MMSRRTGRGVFDTVTWGALFVLCAVAYLDAVLAVLAVCQSVFILISAFTTFKKGNGDSARKG